MPLNPRCHGFRVSESWWILCCWVECIPEGLGEVDQHLWKFEVQRRLSWETLLLILSNLLQERLPDTHAHIQMCQETFQTVASPDTDLTVHCPRHRNLQSVGWRLRCGCIHMHPVWVMADLDQFAFFVLIRSASNLLDATLHTGCRNTLFGTLTKLAFA